MKNIYLFLVFLIPISILSCEKVNNKESSSEQIYFNSFESQSDIDGWQGNAFSFASTASPHGGVKSLKVSGGCVLPHAQYTVDAQSTDCKIFLKLWGKNLSNGGGVSLWVNKAGYKEINISISKLDWTLYESQDTIFCPANTSLTLSIVAGGFIGSTVLVDMIEIRKLVVEP